MLQISKEEYRHRLVKLGASISEAGLDLFLVSSFDSIYYLTGAGRSAYETSEVQTDFEEKIIAQEIATSAFNSDVSDLLGDDVGRLGLFSPLIGHFLAAFLGRCVAAIEIQHR